MGTTDLMMIPPRIPTMNISSLADEELMPLIQGGSSEAFSVLYDRHHRVVYSLAYRICQEATASEEVAQEVFLQAWRNAGAYAPNRGSVRGWMLGITHHRAIDLIRKRTAIQQRIDHAEVEVISTATVEEEAMQVVESTTIKKALYALPTEQRQVIELAYYGGFTHGEIAAMVGDPLGTVKGRMRLGLEKLRGGLDEYGS